MHQNHECFLIQSMETTTNTKAPFSDVRGIK